MSGCIRMDREAVTPVLLAAGRSRRFGSASKLDQPCAGKPLGCWALEAVAAAGLAPGLCVTGPEQPGFLKDAAGEGWRRIVNPDPGAGIGSSLATGARLAAERGSEAMLLVLADMPLVTADHLRALVACTVPAATDYGEGRPGVPALFPATLLPQLSKFSDDNGAASLLAYLPDLILVEPPEHMLCDVDTPEDLAKAEAILQRG